MARRELRFSVLVLTTSFLVGCSGNRQSDIQGLVNDLADKECDAVHLRKARFELADRIRFMEDSLVMQDLNDSIRMAVHKRITDLNPERERVVSGSLELARDISAHLDSLMAGPLKEHAHRVQFDSLLQHELEERGCL